MKCTRVTLWFDEEDSSKFRFSWVFNKMVVPVIQLCQCLAYQIDEVEELL